jgi:hypothetical protein
MWNTLKAIKDEALATAKELREAHNVWFSSFYNHPFKIVGFAS